MIFASNNKGKINEIKNIFKEYKILSLKDANVNIDIPENGQTYYENALIKAKTIYKLTHEPVIADDSGLIFNELKNWPGIYTHRIEEEAKKLGLSRNEYLIKNINEILSNLIK